MCWVIDLHWFIEPTASGRGKGQSLLVWIGTARSSPFGESIFFSPLNIPFWLYCCEIQDLHGFQDGCWILKLRCDVRAHSGSNVFWRLNIFLVKYCCEIQNLSADLITGVGLIQVMLKHGFHDGRWLLTEDVWRHCEPIFFWRLPDLLLAHRPLVLVLPAHCCGGWWRVFLRGFWTKAVAKRRSAKDSLRVLVLRPGVFCSSLLVECSDWLNNLTAPFVAGGLRRKAAGDLFVTHLFVSGLWYVWSRGPSWWLPRGGSLAPQRPLRVHRHAYAHTEGEPPADVMAIWEVIRAYQEEGATPPKWTYWRRSKALRLRKPWLNERQQKIWRSIEVLPATWHKYAPAKRWKRASRKLRAQVFVSFRESP